MSQANILQIAYYFQSAGRATPIRWGIWQTIASGDIDLLGLKNPTTLTFPRPEAQNDL
jgi:hypothetical protein